MMADWCRFAVWFQVYGEEGVWKMSNGNFEEAAAALAAFSEAHEAYRLACASEAQAQATADLASAQLGSATAGKEAADGAAEAALEALLIALEEVGIQPKPPQV